MTIAATLEGRLDALSKSMRESARLVEQVSAELDARAATAKRLQEEAKSAEALERPLQVLIERNMEIRFGVRLVASEHSTGKKHRGRIDCLLQERPSTAALQIVRIEVVYQKPASRRPAIGPGGKE